MRIEGAIQAPTMVLTSSWSPIYLRQHTPTQQTGVLCKRNSLWHPNGAFSRSCYISLNCWQHWDVGSVCCTFDHTSLRLSTSESLIMNETRVAVKVKQLVVACRSAVESNECFVTSGGVHITQVFTSGLPHDLHAFVHTRLGCVCLFPEKLSFSTGLWYEHHATGGRPFLVLLNYLPSIKSSWSLRELVTD